MATTSRLQSTNQAGCPVRPLTGMLRASRFLFILSSMDEFSNIAGLNIAQTLRDVDDALKAALFRYAGILPNSLIRMGKYALSAPGKVMLWRTLTDMGEPAPQPKWPFLVIQSYRAAVPPEERDNWHTVMPAVVAVELAIAAADLIDEAADYDPSPFIEEYGTGQALNTANLMLVMAQQTLVWEAQNGSDRALAALGALQAMLVEAAVGQHLDMSYETMGLQDVTPDMSGEMTDKKAGALMAGAFRMGALMAGVDNAVVELLARFGRQLGGIAQITNDVQDILPAGPSAEGDAPKPKTDLRQRKRTLPIVYALREQAEQPNALQAAFAHPPTEDEDEEAMRAAIVEAGGLNFAALVVDIYSNTASEVLDALEELRPGAKAILSSLMA